MFTTTKIKSPIYIKKKKKKAEAQNFKLTFPSYLILSDRPGIGD